MGNFFSKNCPETKKPTSLVGVGWKPPDDASRSVAGVAVDRGKLDPKDFIFLSRQKEVLIREPGSIGGQQFIVEECSDCDIYLLDHTAALSVDMCTDCRIFTGPCESSVFIRDCKNCTVVVACQQFRTRDCSGCTFFLFSSTQPVIESSADLRFACYTLDYFSLAGQFAAANLSVWNNKWSEIFNFTGGEEDWVCLPTDSHHRDFTSNTLPQAVRQRVGYTDHTNGAVVPRTAGVRGLATEEKTSFIVIMPAHIDAILGKLLADRGGGDSFPSTGTARLLRTKIFRPQPAQSKPFFSGASTSMINAASSSAILGMQWAGPACAEAVVSLLVAAGVIVKPQPQPSPQPSPVAGLDPTNKSNNGSGNGVVATEDYFMADGTISARTKAKVFFEQWEEDKSNPLGR